MKKLMIPLALAMFIGPAAARAEVGVHIDIGLPTAPPLVAVQAGVQIVEGFPEEVFYSGGWYWCRRGDAWYRARSPQAQFMWVEPRRVPAALERMPPGHYRNWHRTAEMTRHRALPVHREERREEHERGRHER